MRLRPILLALALGSLTAGVAEAQRAGGPFGGGPFGDRGVGPQRWSPDDARDGVREGRIRPLRDILRTVESQIPGQLVGGAQLQELPGGRAVYHLRWRTPDGRLLDLAVDAESGAILR